MHIGSKPGQLVYQAKRGGDKFIVVDAGEAKLYLYKTVETMLRPTIAACVEHKDRPYFWAQATGMMYVLSEVSQRSYMEIMEGESPDDILYELELGLENP